MKFTELNLDENLLKGIEDAGFETLMPVQEASFAHTLEGKDVSVQSQTGTGKTAAFLITIFQHFLSPDEKKSKKALILAPTRELAIQIEKDAQLLSRHLDIKCGSFYGGVGYHQQESLLENDVDVIIGTPGRLLDFNRKGKLSFKNIGFLVIDEADRMFDMGFAPDIRRILRNSGERTSRQTMLFSATLDVQTRSIAREFMNIPVKVEIAPEQVTVEKITQTLFHVAQREKLNLLLGILKKDIPNNALIFTNTKHAAAQVAKHLDYNGYKCLHISGDLVQSKRMQVLENFKEGKLPILVATDVAARGLHIEDLEMIINYDLPGDCENYVHRIGRTARAGKSGKAVSLACEDYVYNLEAIENYIGMKIPVAYAEDTLYEASKSEGMTFDTRKRGESVSGRPKGKRTVHSKSPRGSSRRSGSGHGPEQGRRKDRKDELNKDEKRKSDKRRTDKRRDDNRKDDKRKDFKEKEEKRRDETTTRDDSRRTERGQIDKRKSSGPPKGKKRRTAPGEETGDKRKTAAKGPGKGAPRKSQKGSLEDRIEYYKKKYGDNFQAPREQTTSHHDVKFSPPPKKSILKKITSIFSKKKG